MGMILLKQANRKSSMVTEVYLSHICFKIFIIVEVSRDLKDEME
jgi:hypothetical protein